MSINIDKIIYINLERRKDRKENIENELNNYGLNFERYEANEIKVGYCQSPVGCTISHLNVLKLARERNYKNILILEDDFTFLVSKEEFENQLTLFFNENIDYNVCMLSYNLNDSEKTNYDFIVKALDVQTASGYIVNSNYYDKLIALYEWSHPKLSETGEHWIYASDMVWKRYQRDDKFYCFTLRIGKQMAGYSDNSQMLVNYNV
jgi:GR25 family glycosyltransferase involved in LPS biosynthesis